MILHPKVIVIEEDDDFKSIEEWIRTKIKGFRPEYFMCPKNRMRELLDSNLWDIFLRPMFNVKGHSFQENFILYDRRIR